MKAIVAVDRNWGIGKDGKLLCHIPGDLARFRKETTGKTVIMGRKTLESLPGGKPLPGRKNIVLTRSLDYAPAGDPDDPVWKDLEIVHDVSELTELLDRIYGSGGSYESAESGEEYPDAFVIGGASVYELLLPACDQVYVTKIEDVFGADRFFPDLDSDPEFEELMSSGDIIEDGIKYRFVTYGRV